MAPSRQPKPPKRRPQSYQANGKGSAPRGPSRYRQVLSLLPTSTMTGLRHYGLRLEIVAGEGRSFHGEVIVHTPEREAKSSYRTTAPVTLVEPGSVSSDQSNRKLSICPLLPLISFTLSAKPSVRFKRLRSAAGSPTTKLALSLCQAFE